MTGAQMIPVALSARRASDAKAGQPYGMAPEDLAEVLVGEPAYRVRQVWDGLYKRQLRPGEMTDLPASLRARLDASLVPALACHRREVADDGETIKWGWRLADGAMIESVLMHYRSRSPRPQSPRQQSPRQQSFRQKSPPSRSTRSRSTVCVSSQAGCAMACGFCATGQNGFTRHLSTGEIVEQVVNAMREAGERRVSNVVFMGMGEPMANYDRVWAAIVRLQADLGFSARHVTLSTVGLVPGIRRLAAEPLAVNLAVSLHAANDELRDRLVPINRRYPLAKLMEACAFYHEAKGRRLSFEWALMDGINDSAKDAAELALLALPLGAHVNLIPLNPTPGFAVRGTPAPGLARFRRHLDDLGVNATLRATRGDHIDAACGQLAGSLAARS